MPSTTPTPTPQYTGEIISLDLRDYEIKDFFRLISEISGLNVVLDPNVGGTVTLKLTDVPWDQALDVVLKNYNFGAQLQGNVLRIATNATLQAEQTGKKFLAEILAVGGSRPAIDSFQAFRGRPPSIDALLRHSGMAT